MADTVISSSIPDYLVVGHITRDLADNGTYTNGGTVSFASLLANALGCHSGVVTQVCAESDTTTLMQHGVDVHWQPSYVTTTFQNHYTGTVRKQRLDAYAGAISLVDIPELWRSAKIAHIGPIFHECSAESLLAFSDTTYIGVTPQGWLREISDEGYVSHRHLPADVLTNLRNADAVVISLEDIEGAMDYAALLARHCSLLIVTSGWEGGIVFEADKMPWSFPAPSVTEVDPTGAGDIFASTFFMMHATGRSVEEAVTGAACVASQSVKRTGLDSILSREEIQLHCRLT